MTTSGANLLEPQRIRNAPNVDDTSFTSFELGGGTGDKYAAGASFDGDERRFGLNGTIYIASDLTDVVDPKTGQLVITKFEVKQRAYVHELGNLLSRKISPGPDGGGDPFTFGSEGIRGTLTNEPEL